MTFSSLLIGMCFATFGRLRAGEQKPYEIGGGENGKEEPWYRKASRLGIEFLGLMPDELWELTFYELNLLYWHRIRRDRHEMYVAYLNAWWPNHGKNETTPPTEFEFMPLPCDPEYELPQKEPSIEDCKAMMAKNGEGET